VLYSASTPCHAGSTYHPTPRPSCLSGRSYGSALDEAERWRGRAKGVTGNVNAMRTITASAQHLAPVALSRQDERTTSAIDDHVTSAVGEHLERADDTTTRGGRGVRQSVPRGVYQTGTGCANGT
jgi:hypothetical protein